MSDAGAHSDISDDVFEPNTLDDEDGWKDIEPDSVGPSFMSFGSSIRFPSLELFLEDAKENHGVDLIEIQRRYSTHSFPIPFLSCQRAQSGADISGRP